MFDTTDIITRLISETSFTVKRAKIKEIALSEEADLPIVYVGFASLDSRDPTSPAAKEFFSQYGEDLTQGFDIQIVCSEAALVATWRAVHAALVGWNPQPLAEQFSGFTYKQGGVLGLENGRLWWLDKWQVDFPSLYLFN